jgi:hypothetical protein
VWEIFNDSGVYCNFNSFGVTRRVRLDFYKAVTGLELTPEEWSRTKALRILQLQRAMLLLGGPDIKWNPKTDDDNRPDSTNRYAQGLTRVKPPKKRRSKRTRRCTINREGGTLVAFQNQKPSESSALTMLTKRWTKYVTEGRDCQLMLK